MKRNLYLNVQDKETALQNFLSAFEDISPKKEWIPVTESLGRITAEQFQTLEIHYNDINYVELTQPECQSTTKGV